MNDWIWTTLLTLLPITELRGGLPYALLKGNFPFYIAYPFCVLVNTLVAPIAYIFLNSAHKRLYRWNFYARIFEQFIERARGKLTPKIKRWGFWGVTVFIGIPLPITGAWTGTIGAWVLGLSPRRTILAVFIGVALSGLIVATIVLLGMETLNIFIKHV